ncbi:hypothetical protein LWI28_023980 [Acer negundo]|uniref:Uncharacterized protein n=1 Tax=Acer negundo TaxID=4023 RepID=A0AAD5I850_ACENE|nr:hypothetical protein LWI28_023980 [Acer negundo]
MVSPPMFGLVENPMSLEATLFSSSHISYTPICGEGTVSSSSRGSSLGNVLPSIPSVIDNLQVYSLLPRRAPPSSHVVVSSGLSVIGTISSGVSSRSLGVGVSNTSFGLTFLDDQLIVRNGINSSRDMRSESSLSDSPVELGFVTDVP